MRMLFIILFAFIFIILAIGIFFLHIKGTYNNKLAFRDNFLDPIEYMGTNRNLTMEIISKDFYNTGEMFLATLMINNEGEPFQAYFFWNNSNENLGLSFNLHSSSTLKTGENNFSLSAFYAENSGGFTNIFPTLYFFKPGRYKYEIFLYDCSIINTVFNLSKCGNELKESDFLKKNIFKLKSLLFISKIINIIGERKVPECIRDTDCNELCGSCSLGKLVCLSSVCVECFSNKYCKDGFDCQDYKCVLKS